MGSQTSSSWDPAAPADPHAGLFGLTCSPHEAGVVVLPVPFDATSSYGTGASQAPQAIVAASHYMDLYDRETGRPYEAGLWMPPLSEEILDWNATAQRWVQHVRAHPDSKATLVPQINALGDALNTWVYEATRDGLRQGRRMGILGGDHSVPFGAILAYTEAFKDLGILHIDAHADLRDAYEGLTWSHASIMHNVITRTHLSRLVQVGIRDFAESEWDMIQGSHGRIVTFFDQDLTQQAFEGIPFVKILEPVVSALPQDVYVSLDIDGLDPTLCPHTGTPVPGGLSFQQTCALLAAVSRSGRRIVGFDLTEVVPGPTGWDANVGARLLYKLCGHSVLEGGPAKPRYQL